MKRNQFILLSLCAVIFAVSCQKELVNVTPDGCDRAQYPVQFSSYIGRTRSAVNPLGDGVAFNMYAEYIFASDTSRFYSCVKYQWNGEYFISNPVYYWPADGALDFYAVSPASSSFLPGKTVNATISDGKADLLTAKALNQERGSSVTMPFGHKLTKLSFKAIGEDTRLRYQIDSIKITAGSSAKYDMATDTWGTATTALKYSYMSSAPQIIGKNTTSAVDIEGTLMLLPVQTSVKLEIGYKAYEGDVLVHDGVHEIDLTSTAASSTAAACWGINKHINYTLKLAPGDCLVLTATVSDWDNVSPNVEVHT